MYKLIKDSKSGLANLVQKEGKGIVYTIPFAPDNTDYQEYLKWLAEGNTPEPADE